MRKFDLGDILSVTTGRLVSTRHVGGVYDILGYMTGEQLFTHQLPRASRQCEGPLLQQLPQLASIEVPDDFSDADDVYAWLDKQKAIYGEVLPVEPISDGTDAQNPIEELCDMVGSERVFVARVDR